MKWFDQIRLLKVRVVPWLLNLFNRGHYPLLSEEELRATCKSDTLFIFGSGYSINDISCAEWSYFEEHDTLSFNWFIHQDHVRVDYHLVREIGPNDFESAVWKPKIYEYANLIRNNPHYANTIFLVQGGWYAINGNRIVGMKLLPKQATLFRFHNKRRSTSKAPSSSFANGLVHGPATLVDCINFAYILGWKRIVLVGVDLYDRRYFWLGDNETRDYDKWRRASYQDQHRTSNSIIPFLANWDEIFMTKGPELYVYNPRSLLAQVLPVFDRDQLLQM